MLLAILAGVLEYVAVARADCSVLLPGLVVLHSLVLDAMLVLPSRVFSDFYICHWRLFDLVPKYLEELWRQWLHFGPELDGFLAGIGNRLQHGGELFQRVAFLRRHNVGIALVLDFLDRVKIAH